MSVFSNLFQKKETLVESVVLIDIGATSIAIAYVHYQKDTLPELLYSERIPIEEQENETREHAMLHTLETLGNGAIGRGVSALTRATGKGESDLILVSIDAPWQETHVRSETFETAEPFIFTHKLVNNKLEETRSSTSEKMIVDETIIGSTLNGYETRNPYGKKAQYASIVILTSLIEKGIAKGIVSTLHRLFHTNDILPIAGNSLRYQAIRLLFPYEQDAIILDASNDTFISIALIRKGIFVTLFQVPEIREDESLINTLTNELSLMATRYPLPRTIFLLSRESDTTVLAQALNYAPFTKLWFSETPPKIILISVSQMSAAVKQSSESTDLICSLMAIYYQNRNLATSKKS